MFDEKITERMRVFVQADPSGRDYAEANEILFRVSANVYQYNMIRRKGPDNFKALLDKRLTELYEFRVRKITHAQVRKMSDRADKVVAAAPSEEKKVKAGKRPDHDSLPPEVQAMYAETLDLLRRERDLHLQIRRLALSKSSCPDSELYPFVKEICRLDDRRLSLWKSYDSFKVDGDE